MIHVCFSLHDKTGNYSKYAGVAICSLLVNAKSNITVHIIHDSTVSDENLAYFRKLVDLYGQSIELYKIKSSEFKNIEKMSFHCTVGTLFRLMIPNVLPDAISKVIYLDADLIFGLDIKELWDIDLEDNIVAARLDLLESRRNSWVCKNGLVPYDRYFNAGVMILDLQKIRSDYRMLEDCSDFLMRHPECTFCDQDAVNVLFAGKVKYIDDRYNSFTVPLRDSDQDILGNSIYHFAGDYVHVENLKLFDELFISYLARTPWWNAEDVVNNIRKLSEKKREQSKAFHLFLDCMAKNRKKIIFGAQSRLIERLQDLFKIDEKKDYFVDNSEELQGKCMNGVKVHSPDIICSEAAGTFLVIIFSQKHYDDIKEQLQGYGFTEYKDFIDGRILIDDSERNPIRL